MNSLSKFPDCCQKLFQLKISNLKILQRKSKTKVKCQGQPFPRCSKENLAKTDCMKNRAEFAAQQLKRNPLLYKPECCTHPCKDFKFPRFDDLYYEISKKEKRKYAQTWIECPKKPPRIRINFDKLDLPPLQRRKINKCELTAKNMKGDDCELMNSFKCPIIKLPCGHQCRPGRRPPTCGKERKMKDCKKISAPCPSFSECDRKQLPPGPKIECRCHENESWCGITRKVGMSPLNCKPEKDSTEKAASKLK